MKLMKLRKAGYGYGWNSGSFTKQPAVWGLYDGDRLIARLKGHRGGWGSAEWSVIWPLDSELTDGYMFPSRARAREWAEKQYQRAAA